jgi:hypothetical protein
VVRGPWFKEDCCGVAAVAPFSAILEQCGANGLDCLAHAGERTIDDLWKRIGVILDETSPQECRNYIRHDGYA